MGRQKWFRSPFFKALWHCASAALTAIAEVVTQYMGNNRKKKKKGGPKKRKKKS